ncbi:MAG: PhoH family protein [Anaerovoracaceae bacterium]|nr:PhoH family protein [Bacillota bacterium]MDY2670311.1 PhoH family protein [Anaerovoracaceae bacterium]
MQNNDSVSNTKRIEITDAALLSDVFGENDANMELLQKKFNVNVVLRGDDVIVSGENADEAESAIRDMAWLVGRGDTLDEIRTEEIIDMNAAGRTLRKSGIRNEIICFSNKGKPIKPKTRTQAAYVASIRDNDVSFGIGPAGTGKTYLSVAMAVKAFKDRDVEKIVLTRPAVEAGESLGFLPGDMEEKVNPYLRPLYDALYDIFGRDTVARLRDRETIEIIPLAYMRGRTLDNSFIILDEAQNTTKEQMKMFLTRLGFGSKAVITGDVTQIDLPKKRMSGLVDAKNVLRSVEGIGFTFFDDRDVVRHPLVRKIISAYESAGE